MAKGPKTRTELKAWLAKRLKLPDVPDFIWDDADVQDCFERCLDGGAAPQELREDLLAVAKRLHKVATEGPKQLAKLLEGDSQKTLLSPPKLDEYQRIRADAFAAFAAREAAGHRGVQAFRQDVLGDRLLTREEADAFVQSVVLALASLEQCAAWGIPPIGHTWWRTGGGYDEGYWEYHVDPPGTTIRLPAPGWSDHIVPSTLAYPLEYETEDDPIMNPGSVLDTLVVLCEDLARGFGWDIRPGVLFVLTGERPTYEPARASAVPIMAGSYQRVEITLRVDAWLSDDEVARAYRAARHELGVPKSGRAKERNLRLFRFVTERTADAGRHPTWRELRDEWNREAPVDERYPDVRNFRRDYERGREHVLFPTCALYGMGRGHTEGEDTDEPDA